MAWRKLSMDWTVVIVAVVVVAAFWTLKRASFVSVDQARGYLAGGALVIDVRSPEEFRGGSVPGAINIPLGQLRDGVSRQVKDKHQVLLVHCLSGGRSAVAQHQLKGMGYANVHNLGSLTRAREIVQASRP